MPVDSKKASNEAHGQAPGADDIRTRALSQAHSNGRDARGFSPDPQSPPPLTTPASRFLLVFVATVGFALGSVAAFNATIDPYDVVRAVEIPWLNARKPAQLRRARLRKPFDLWRRRYDGIVLGTSQAEFALDTANPTLLARGIALYNAGISEQRPFEQALLLRHAAEIGRIRFAMVSLDFLRYVGGGGRPQFLPKDWTRWHGVAEYLHSLISVSAAIDSMDTISANWSGRPTLQHLPDGRLNVDDYFAVTPEPPARTQFDAVDGYYVNEAYRIVLEQRAALERSGFDHTALRDMAAIARRHGITLHVFIPPSHARQAEIITYLGLEPLYRQWASELACFLADESASARGEAFPLWDFSGYNEVTTELIPAAAEGRMRWYHDSVHFSARTGRAIEDRLLGFASPELSRSESFGATLTPAGLRWHFARKDEARRHYLGAHPETEQQIAKLYQGPARPIAPVHPVGEPACRPSAASLSIDSRSR